MFGQTFDARDLILIGLLVVLEGVLSIDNALVLGLLARRLPKHLQSKALTYGLAGAFVFRVIAIAAAAYLLHWRFVKLLGGAYLVYVSAKHFFFEGDEPAPEAAPRAAPEQLENQIAAHEPAGVAALDAALGGGHAGFWPTVVVIELTDIAFAVDSILAAIAMIPSVPGDRTNPKLWVVLTGGMFGVILMRFAAVLFIRLLERFPRFETSAYLLVAVIGLKLLSEWWFNTNKYANIHPNDPIRLDYHDFQAPEFWVFWVLMIACFAIGFIPRRGHPGGGVNVAGPGPA